MDLRRARGFKGRNLLHFAAEKGRLDLCRFLIEESGFNPNSTSAEGTFLTTVVTRQRPMTGGTRRCTTPQSMGTMRL
nr:unnamed protein product [Digitaria exilis]